MSERSSYLPGTPSWVDVQSPDTAAAAAFYEGLFGWKAEIDPRPEAGGYGMFTLDGKLVAGLGPQMDPAMPPLWAVYVSVDDAEATVAASEASGGTTAMGVTDIFDAGRMAVLADPVGSYVSIWQPGRHTGAQLVNEPGTFAWNELATPDLAAARAFYTSVFGWGVDEAHSGDQAAIFTVAGEVTCGAHAGGEGEHPAWSVWFAVEDCDRSAALAEELGGSVVMAPGDMDFGRGAVIADPHGAVLGIGAMSDATAASAT